MNSRLKARICAAVVGILFISLLCYGILTVYYGVAMNIVLIFSLLMSLFPFLILTAHYGFKHQLESGAKDPMMEHPRLVKILRGLFLGLAILFIIVGIVATIKFQDALILVLTLYFSVIFVIFERDLVLAQKKYVMAKPTLPYREYMRKTIGRKYYISLSSVAIILLTIGIIFPEIFWLMISYSGAVALGALINYLYLRKKSSEKNSHPLNG